MFNFVLRRMDSYYISETLSNRNAIRHPDRSTRLCSWGPAVRSHGHWLHYNATLGTNWGSTARCRYRALRQTNVLVSNERFEAARAIWPSVCPPVEQSVVTQHDERSRLAHGQFRARRAAALPGGSRRSACRRSARPTKRRRRRGVLPSRTRCVPCASQNTSLVPPAVRRAEVLRLRERANIERRRTTACDRPPGGWRWTVAAARQPTDHTRTHTPYYRCPHCNICMVEFGSIGLAVGMCRNITSRMVFACAPVDSCAAGSWGMNGLWKTRKKNFHLIRHGISRRQHWITTLKYRVCRICHARR